MRTSLGRLLPFLLCLLIHPSSWAVDFGVLEPFPPALGERVWHVTATDLNGDGLQDVVYSFLNGTDDRVKVLRRTTTGWAAPIELNPFNANPGPVTCLRAMGPYILVGYREGYLGTDFTKFRVWNFNTSAWLPGVITTSDITVGDCQLMSLKATNDTTIYDLVVVFSQTGYGGRGFGVFRHSGLSWSPFTITSTVIPSPGYITQTGPEEFLIGRNDGQRGSFFGIHSALGVQQNIYTYTDYYNTAGPVWKVFNTLYYFHTNNPGLSRLTCTGTNCTHARALVSPAPTIDFGIAGQFDFNVSLITQVGSNLRVYREGGAIQQTVWGDGDPMDTFVRIDLNLDRIPDLLVLKKPSAPASDKRLMQVIQNPCTANNRCVTGDHCILGVCKPHCTADPSVCPAGSYCQTDLGGGTGRCLEYCLSTAQCSGFGMYCYYGSSQCEFPCTIGSCPGAEPCVYGECTNTCVNDFECPGIAHCREGICNEQCTSDPDCSHLSDHYCYLPQGTCEERCTQNSDCPEAGESCVFGKCEPPCTNDLQCPGSSYCNQTLGQCEVPCSENRQCGFGGLCKNDGKCSEEVSIQIIPTSSLLVPVDINVDGHMDLLAVQQSFMGPTVYALTNKASDPGYFDPSLITNSTFLAGNSYSDVTVGDCDGDGKPDILIGLTAAGFNGEVATLRSSEGYDAVNASRTSVPGGYGVESIHVADFDGDGKLDLAVMPKSGFVSVFQGDGNCGFNLRWTSGQNFVNGPMVVGNVDGFAGSELVVGQGNNLYIYQFNRRTWSFGLPFVPMSNVPFAGSALLRLGNLASNGNLEINVVLSDRTLIYEYDPLNNPSDLQYHGMIDEGGVRAAIGNLRGDRRNELILGSAAATYFVPRFSSIGVHDSVDGLVERVYSANAWSYNDLRIVDVTGDRLPDIVALRSDSFAIVIYPGKADVFAAPQSLGGATRKFRDIKLTDVDRDGVLDIYYLASGSSHFGWRKGPGFSTDTSSSIAEDYESFAIADLNSDGRMDVVFFSSIASQKSHRAMGTGSGFGPWELLGYDRTEVGGGVPASRSVGVVGTFDSIGRPEFFVGNSGGANYLLRYDADVLGELNAETHWTGATAYRTKVAASGDINGDGFTDVVIGGSHATVQTANWLQANGTGQFVNRSLPNLSNATQTGVALADFNQDGKLDIVFAQGIDRHVVLLQGAGNNFATIDWQSPAHLPGQETTDVTAIDLNSDGYPDLVFTSKDGDAVQIYFNNADPVNFGFYSGEVFSGGEWEAVAAGDVDNDGDIDLIVAPTDGTLHILQNLLYVPPGTDDEGLLVNQPTTAVVYRPGSPLNFEDGGTGRPVNGLVHVPVVLRDAESDFANLIMEYRAVGSSVWVEFANELRLAATPGGVTHQIEWDTTGFPVGEYEVRATVIQTPTVGMTAVGSTIALSPPIRVGGCLGGCGPTEVCVGTSCQPECTESSECGVEGCYGESFCAPLDPADAEADVDCLPGYENDGVNCVLTCIDNSDCTAPNVCFPDGCMDPTNLCANVACLEDYTCLVGECVLDAECLSNTDCPPTDPTCYVASSGAGVCGPDDLCELVECLIGSSCTLGTCFSDPVCEPPLIEYPGLGCAPPPISSGPHPCDGVVCPIGEVCIIGGEAGISCEPTCSVDADCLEPGHVCYDGQFCGPLNLCGGLVECPPLFGCSDGGCYPICSTDDDCVEPLFCNENLCRDGNEPCNGVLCSEGQSCYLGSCFPSCDDSGDCNPPFSYCMDSKVCLEAYDLCQGLICPLGMVCHQGQCVLSCSDEDPCVAPYACYTTVCAEDACDLTCPDGMICYQQGCHTMCDDTDDCAYYDQCHTSLISPVGPDRCAVEPCGNVFCLLGETCFGGVCAPLCGPGGTCVDPNHVCYNNEICLPADPCEGIYCPVGQTCFGGDCRLACSLNDDCPGFVGTGGFRNVAEQVGLATPWSKNAGVAWGDFNNDGCLDLALNTSSGTGRSRLYLSDCNANPMFTDVSHTVLPIDGSGNSHFLKYGRERSIVWGDFNNDGYLDLARNTQNVINIYANSGPPSYTLELKHAYTIPDAGGGRSAMNSEGMGWIDYDGDGWLDLFAEDEEYGVLMYQNLRDGNFNRVELSGLLYPASFDRNGDYCAVADINLDGHVDILCRKPNPAFLTVASDLFFNNGDGTFSGTGSAIFNQPAGSNKGGVTICDINNNGRFDIIWTDNGVNQIWLQGAGGSFTATGEPAASSGFAFPANKMNDVLCGDVDNDGRNDLFWIGEEGSYLFLNRTTDTDLKFVFKSLGINSTSKGLSGAMADYNRDGSLDILVHAEPSNELWQNPRSDNRYLMIRALVDLEASVSAPAGTVRDGIGATVIIQDVDGEILGMREVNGARGRGSQDPAIMHYGLLYGADVPYKLTVIWPHGARVTKCVVPGAISGYQLVEIKDTDPNDVVACLTAGDWKSRIETATFGEPQQYCFDGTCASSACEGVTCLKGSTCYGGVCEPDCTTCVSPKICADNACVPDLCNDGKFVCPTGYTCTNGSCEPECEVDSDCGVDEQCYQGTCNPTTCDSVVCPFGQNCHKGICFNDCSDCMAPNICVKDRCVANHCAALDDEFDESYIFRKAKGHVSATRHSLPWFWPDPFVGGTFSTWAGLSGNSVTNTDVPAPHTARVTLYLDRTLSSGSQPEGRYILWFNQGAADGAQRPAQATYRVRVDGVKPEVVFNDDNESWDIIDTNMSDYFVVQSHVTSGSGETGGIAIGRFRSSDDKPWFISIDADFAGDIRRWEWVNADGSVIELDPKETLNLSISSPDGKYYSPAAGRTCLTGQKGICQRGTSYCANGERRCTPTVLPWAFEICDGLDNTCNGQIDEPENLRFPGVEWRDNVTSWQLLTTMDKPQSVQSTMNFVPEGTDDRVGSTNLVSSDGTPIQAWNRAVIAMHRDLTTGSLSLLIANGLRETGAHLSGLGDYDVETRLSFPGEHTSEELFPAWWDDREPASNGDEIPEDFRLDRMDLEWKLRQGSTGATAWREADTVAMMTRWSGASQSLREFETRYRWTKHDNNNPAPRHLNFGIHQPGQDFRGISRTRTVQIRVTPQRQAETACWANGLTTVGGCGFGYYQCGLGGVISCGDPTDGACDRCVDADGDGYAGYDEITCPTGRDCDDNDPTIHPGAPERCNGRDNDCDGLVDIKSDQAYFDRWGEVRPSGAATCPVGADECGPQECQFRNVCVCPDGPEDPADPPSVPCYCGEGLAVPQDESAVCTMP